MCEISVLIPAYNSSSYIEKCVRSVLSQTFQDFEVIIINDGSTDGTKQILEILAAKDSRIRLYNQKNQGIGASRKRALELAKGKYFQFIDSDDWVDDDFLEAMYGIAEEYNADIVEAAGYYCHHNHDRPGIFNTVQLCVSDGVSEQNALEVASKIVKREHPSFLWTKFFRRNFVTENNINFVEGIDFGEDAHFVCRACFFHPKYCNTSRFFYHFINNPTSTTKTRFTLKNFQCRIAWIQDLDTYCKNPFFKEALWSMKFFIKEEAALSRLFPQEEYLRIFPDVMRKTQYVRVNPLRKLLVKMAVTIDNQKIGKWANSRLAHYLGHISNKLGRKLGFFG